MSDPLLFIMTILIGLLLVIVFVGMVWDTSNEAAVQIIFYWLGSAGTIIHIASMFS